jgi:toxin ParE1/3/4
VKRRYRLSPQAQADIGLIWEYIAGDSEAAADRLVARLDKAFQTLAASPRLGHRRADVPAQQDVLFWVEGLYVIVYRTKPQPLSIVRVIHGARNLEALL